MQRTIDELVHREFDIAVVGGGIYGACIAWDAAQRGLSVALIEQSDFGHATSAHSFKMVHGGIRYLQHADLRRVRQSTRERRAFMRIAPHLVHPLPIVIPTYGHGRRGRHFLAAGGHVYDLVTADRNRGIRDPARRIPRTRSLTREECLDLNPNLDSDGLTGGLLFHDGQMYNPPRLVLAFVKAAHNAGCVPVNYARATGFLRTGDRVRGVEVEDLMSEERFAVRARTVINAAGPWANRLLLRSLGIDLDQPVTFSRDTYFVVPRRLTGETALAVLGKTRDPDAIISRDARHLFIAPWRDVTLVGVWHVVHDGDPDDIDVTTAELDEYVAEINAACPRLELTRDDVSACHAGLVLFGENDEDARHLRYGHRSLIVDHEESDGLGGLMTVVGVRYTTARDVAERVIDRAAANLEATVPRSRTAATPLPGGSIDDIEALVDEVDNRYGGRIGHDTAEALVRNYGTEYQRIVHLIDEEPSLAERIGDSTVLAAEVVHAAREEMATALGDVVYRRTDLGTNSPPSHAMLERCAALMGPELGWTPDDRERETRVAANEPIHPLGSPPAGLPQSVPAATIDR